MNIGDGLLTITENIYIWIRKHDGTIWAWLLLMLFNIVNFLVFQLVNFFAQLRWPLSAIVRFIKSFRVTPAGHPIPVDDIKLQKLLKENHAVFVDFWTEWCGPCILMETSIKEFARQYAGKIVVAKVDATINPKLTKKYNVMGYPTLMMFLDGEEVGRIPHALNYKTLVKLFGAFAEDD